MSRPRRLLCSLAVVALTLLVIGPAARAASIDPSHLVEVKDAGSQPAMLLLDDGQSEQSWTLVWSDLGVTDGNASSAAVGAGESFARLNVPSPQAPAVIAAPLPPALLPGLIGLAGVYAYKRRHRLR